MLMYYQLKNNHFSKNYSNCDIMLMILLDEFLPVLLRIELAGDVLYNMFSRKLTEKHFW